MAASRNSRQWLIFLCLFGGMLVLAASCSDGGEKHNLAIAVYETLECPEDSSCSGELDGWRVHNALYLPLCEATRFNFLAGASLAAVDSESTISLFTPGAGAGLLGLEAGGDSLTVWLAEDDLFGPLDIETKAAYCN